jgi:hypothetical protein
LRHTSTRVPPAAFRPLGLAAPEGVPDDDVVVVVAAVPPAAVPFPMPLPSVVVVEEEEGSP